MSLEKFEALTLTEIIRLQDQLSQIVARRFSRQLALAFTDIVGSTEYFARYGNEAGRLLQQRHTDLLRGAIGSGGGRIVDTAGDGAFTCFPTAESAADALIALQVGLARDNAARKPDEVLQLRMGMHLGTVLTDGEVVTGDAVNLCARVTASSDVDEIRVTKAAFVELSNRYRLRCRTLGPVPLKGINAPTELLALEWRDPDLFPTKILLEETRKILPLPSRPTVAFGRLDEIDGQRANDIVLELPDPEQTNCISRWHFELRRLTDGLILRSRTDQSTAVDGRELAKGEEARVKPGSRVRVGNVLTILFFADDRRAMRGNETTAFAIPKGTSFPE